MASRWRTHVLVIVTMAALLLPEYAYAYSPLSCTNGQPDSGTSLYDAGPSGACQFVGIRYIFSTVICQFVTMINVIMGKLYCSIQAAVTPVIIALMTLYVAVFGVQILMGTAQLNGSEVITRMIKMSLILWLATDSTFGVSAGISYMFNFFISFISESTRWVVSILAQGVGLNFYTNYGYNAGVTSTFKYIDDWVFNALTGTVSPANAKVIGFFVTMGFAMPSIAMLGLYWWVSMAKMLVSTLLSFLMAIISVAFLLGLSPIFLGFMLFQITFNYFDQWVRFMVSFCLQVMISFAILTLWLFSLTLFTPFFNELSTVIFRYEKMIRPAAAVYQPVSSWGLCPMVVAANPIPRIRCENPNFNPVGPSVCGPSNIIRPCYDDQDNVIDPTVSTGTTGANADYRNIVPPSRVPELSGFLYYIFYHMISLIIVCYGFASLQKNSRSIATQLAGPSFVPILNASGVSNIGHWRGHGGGGGGGGLIGGLQGAQAEANQFMSRAGFDHKTATKNTPYQQIINDISKMLGR
ncbi:MAG: type IV secretion system protein [Alphaproteobacteria bacterium]|nr:type IV secretion system protein [Alphaproteobacteria bacterium]